jgi:hypothetical protein
VKLKPLRDLPPPWCPVCTFGRTDAWAIEIHNDRCARFGERSYWKAAGHILVLLLLLDPVRSAARDWVLDPGPIANCPNHAGVVIVPTDWQLAQGRKHRTILHPPCHPITSNDWKRRYAATAGDY